MEKKKKNLAAGLAPWVEARRRFHLSHAHVQMARELGMNPHKLGKLDNDDQEHWKAPLPVFIEELYEQRFGRSSPELVVSLEERARQLQEKENRRRERKLERRRQRALQGAPVSRPGERDEPAR